MQLRLNLYKGVGADNLSADVVEQEKETSYAYGVALVTGVPLQLGKFIVNNYVLITIGLTPFFINKGYYPQSSIELLEPIKKTAI